MSFTYHIYFYVAESISRLFKAFAFYVLLTKFHSIASQWKYLLIPVFLSLLPMHIPRGFQKRKKRKNMILGSTPDWLIFTLRSWNLLFLASFPDNSTLWSLCLHWTWFYSFVFVFIILECLWHKVLDRDLFLFKVSVQLFQHNILNNPSFFLLVEMMPFSYAKC